MALMQAGPAQPVHRGQAGGNINQPMLQANPNQAAAAIYGPQQNALNAQQQNTLNQQALNGQQFSQSANYAHQQYGTAVQGLGLDRQDIGQQQQGLLSDRGYLKQSNFNNVKNFQNDIHYDNQQRQFANQLYGAMMRGYNVQGGAHGTIQQQLSEALGTIAAQRSQAQGQFGNATQQLGEQVGAQGAFGSRGAVQRQGFIQSTLNNTLAGLFQAQRGAQTQATQQRAQLGQQIAQAKNQRQGSLSLANRRKVSAQYGIQQANEDLQHALAGNTISSNRLKIQAARLGVSQSQYANALSNAVNQAGLNYGSGLSNSVAQMAQYGPQQQQIWFNQLGAANALGQSGYNNQGVGGPVGIQGPQGP